MIKAKGTRDGKPFMLLGLSYANIELLKQDRPILFDASELGLPDVQVAIIVGETEGDLIREMRLQSWWNNTTVHADPTLDPEVLHTQRSQTHRRQRRRRR